MALPSAILLSNDDETISVCIEGSNELEVTLIIKNDFPSLILDIQENDYRAILCDCSNNFQRCSNWIKVIKNLRPKVSLIVIVKEIDKSTGGKLYQEGIFHLCKKPLNKDYLKEVLSAILTSIKSGGKIKKFE